MDTFQLSAFKSAFECSLVELVGMRSPYTERENVIVAMDYCNQCLSGHLGPTHHVHSDIGGNLICIPKSLSNDLEIVWLSAHIDTVPVMGDWHERFDPFVPTITDDEIVGLGVNDCKAGVAFMLALAQMASIGRMELRNIALAITFKEEGPGPKTAAYVAKSVVETASRTNKRTLLVVLENTTMVDPAVALSAYVKESTSYSIEVRGTLEQIQSMLRTLSRWNPVSIVCETYSNKLPEKSWSLAGGHICTTARDENPLVAIILGAESGRSLNSNNAGTMAQLPTKVEQHECVSDHRLVLTLRDQTPLELVQSELQSIAHRELKPLVNSQGMSTSEAGINCAFVNALAASSSEAFPILFATNPGSSDATTILASLPPDVRKMTDAIVVGPGCRSNRSADPIRLTHGVNETFYKRTGLAAVKAILEAMTRSGNILVGGELITPEQL